MRISTALCTYNGAKYLPEQLESILRQTRRPDELIISDDASTDETPSIIVDFAETAPFPVRTLFHENNVGSCRNFEKAIGRCRGDVIALSDQDDVWLPKKLERMEDIFIARPNVGLIFSDAVLTDSELNPMRRKLWHLTFRRRDRRKFDKGKAIDVLLRYNVVTGATMAFRSDLRAKILPFPALTGLIHDGWISLAAALYSEVFYINEALIKYRQHADQQLGLKFPVIGGSVRERHQAFIKQKEDAISRLDETEKLLSEGKIFSEPLDSGDSIDKEELLRLINKSRTFVRCTKQHYEIRKTMHSSMTKRIGPIFRELIFLRYHRFSRGFLSAAVDLTGD